MRVILQRDLVLSGGKHGKKGQVVDMPENTFYYLKNNGAVIAHRDEAVRTGVPAQPPVIPTGKGEVTLTGKPAVQVEDAPSDEIESEEESLLTGKTPKGKK